MNAILPNAPLGATSSAFFALQPHPVHPRLRHVALDPAAMQAFLRSSADIDIQNLEYVPFMRHMLAGRLEACAGPGLCEALNGLAQDRRGAGSPPRSRSARSPPDPRSRLPCRSHPR
jgi:glutarate dioxygenase